MCVRRAKTQKGAEESPKEITAKKPPEATTDVNLHSQKTLKGIHTEDISVQFLGDQENNLGNKSLCKGTSHKVWFFQ